MRTAYWVQFIFTSIVFLLFFLQPVLFPHLLENFFNDFNNGKYPFLSDFSFIFPNLFRLIVLICFFLSSHKILLFYNYKLKKSHLFLIVSTIIIIFVFFIKTKEDNDRPILTKCFDSTEIIIVNFSNVQDVFQYYADILIKHPNLKFIDFSVKFNSVGFNDSHILCEINTNIKSVIDVRSEDFLGDTSTVYIR